MRLSKAVLEIALAKKQMTIKKLIETSGCSSATIQKAKQGKRISPKTAGKISNALKCDVSHLVLDDDTTDA